MKIRSFSSFTNSKKAYLFITGILLFLLAAVGIVYVSGPHTEFYQNELQKIYTTNNCEVTEIDKDPNLQTVFCKNGNFLYIEDQKVSLPGAIGVYTKPRLINMYDAKKQTLLSIDEMTLEKLKRNTFPIGN